MSTLPRLLFLLGFASLFLSCSKEKNTGTKEPVTELPYTKIELIDLHPWQQPDENSWKIVSRVQMGREQANDLHVENGTGVLLFAGDGGQAVLDTKFNHEDLDLKLDFMLSAGAKASLLLQGHYQISLIDSWKAGTDSSMLLCGTIVNGKQVIRPELNASRAPGLWQHLVIRFKAARFDRTGALISNARLLEVTLNGKQIHKDVVAADTKMVQPGPLRIAGSDGVFALRNVQYKTYRDDRIILSGMTFNVYKGLYKKYDTLKSMSPVRSGIADSLHWKYGDKRAQISFSGKITAPSDGDYLFRLRAGGPAWVLIDDHEIVNNKNTRDYTRSFNGVIRLTKGDHSLSIMYGNYDESLVVEYAGPEIPLTMLTAHSSERKVSPVEPWELPVNDVPVIQRGFFTHHNKVDPYAISVGMPGGVHYSYDMTTFNLLAVWRGQFADVSNMWRDRGEPQLLVPLGAALALEGTPAVLELTDPDQPWIDTVAVDNNVYTKRGYRINTKGEPVFLYTYQSASVEDHMEVNNDRTGLSRTLTIKFHDTGKPLSVRLGVGKGIARLADGEYTINDQAYYITNISGVDQGQLSIVKSGDDQSELRVNLKGEPGLVIKLTYSIIW